MLNTIDEVKNDWKALCDLEAAGKILDVYGFGDDDEDVDAIVENQCSNLVARYMEAAGKDETQAHAELLEFYSLADAIGARS